MRDLRAFLHGRCHLALLLVALALCVKALVPAGYMVSTTSSKTLTIAVCSAASQVAHTVDVVIPVKSEGGKSHTQLDADSGHCAFGALGMAGLGGADPYLLALAFAFILIIGLAPLGRLPYSHGSHLRPPLRGPPATT